MNLALRYRWIGPLLMLALFWVLSACISLGPLFRPSSSEIQPPPKKTKSGSDRQAPTGTQPLNSSGPRRNGQASANGSLGTTRTTYLHTVRWEGETLCLIAQWYTGSWKNWRTLADSNSGMNPDRLVIGDKVLIPKELLKNRKPLPRDLVLSLAAKERGQQPSSHPGEIEPLDLFGPKD